VVRTYTNIEEIVLATIKIERVVGNLKETLYDPLMEEKDEDAIRESFIDKLLSMLNETLI